MNLKLRELVLLSFLGAILAVSQIALSFLPNIEVVSLLIIIFGLVYGKKSIYSVAVFVVIQGLFYGFGTWWLGYAIIWPILIVLTLLLKKWLAENYLALSIFSGAYGFFFGMLFSVPYIFISGWKFAFLYWLRGIPYDLVHMLGNYFIMLLLGKVIYNLLIRLNKQYYSTRNF